MQTVIDIEKAEEDETSRRTVVQSIVEEQINIAESGPAVLSGLIWRERVFINKTQFIYVCVCTITSCLLCGQRSI